MDTFFGGLPPLPLHCVESVLAQAVAQQCLGLGNRSPNIMVQELIGPPLLNLASVNRQWRNVLKQPSLMRQILTLVDRMDPIALWQPEGVYKPVRIANCLCYLNHAFSLAVVDEVLYSLALAPRALRARSQQPPPPSTQPLGVAIYITPLSIGMDNIFLDNCGQWLSLKQRPGPRAVGPDGLCHSAALVAIAGAKGLLYAIERVCRQNLSVRKLRVLPDGCLVEDHSFPCPLISLSCPLPKDAGRCQEFANLSPNGQALVVQRCCKGWQRSPWIVVDTATGAVVFKWDFTCTCCSVTSLALGNTGAILYTSHEYYPTALTVNWRAAKDLYRVQAPGSHLKEFLPVDNQPNQSWTIERRLAPCQKGHDFEFFFHLEKNVFLWICIFSCGLEQIAVVDFATRHYKTLYQFKSYMDSGYWTCATFMDALCRRFVILHAVGQWPIFLQLTRSGRTARFTGARTNSLNEQRPLLWELSTPGWNSWQKRCGYCLGAPFRCHKHLPASFTFA